MVTDVGARGNVAADMLCGSSNYSQLLHDVQLKDTEGVIK